MKKKVLIIGLCVAVVVVVAFGARYFWKLNTDASTMVTSDGFCEDGFSTPSAPRFDDCWDPTVNYSGLMTGKDYYVSEGGSDSAAGTASGTAFATIRKAASLAGPGDEIIVSPGTYNEDVEFANKGLPDKPIALRASDKKNRPIILKQSDASIQATENLIIDGIITDGGTTVTLTGHKLGRYGVRVQAYSDPYIKNIMILDSEMRNHAEALRAMNGRRLIMRNVKVVGCEKGIIIGDDNIIDTFVDTYFENVETADSPYRDDANDGLVIEGRFGHHVVKNSSAHGYTDAGLDIKPNNVIVNGFTTYNNDTGMKIWRSARVMNSIAYGNAKVNYAIGNEDGSGINAKFVNNISADGDIRIDKGSEGLETNATPQTVKISHNIFYNTEFHIDGRFTGANAEFLEAGDHNLFFDSQSTSGFTVPETTSIFANPEFTNYVKGDFKITQNFQPKATSRSINAGVASAAYAPIQDKLGIIRPQGGKIDVGPFEKQESSDPGDGDSGGDEGDGGEPVNLPPVIQEIPEKLGFAGKPIVFRVIATDPENNDMVYQAENLPTGATLNSNTGRFTWTPSISQASLGGKIHNITFVVGDRNGNRARADVKFTVFYTPTRPLIDITVAPTKCKAPCALQFQVVGRPPIGTPTTYEWDFNTASPLDSDIATGSKVSHTYSKPGTYTVLVQMWTDLGHRFGREFTITVR